MKKIRLFPGVLIFTTAMTLWSCGEDVAGGGSATGSIAPAVSIDALVIGADVESRAASDPAPQVGDLSLTVTSDDGSFVRTWDRLADFSTEEKFPVGYYNVEVNYGDREAEGFDCTPAYYASQRIKVIEAVTVPVEMTAARTHAEVNVSYTDAFKNYMSRATTRVETVSGHKSYFVTSATFTEERSSLIVPGKTVVYVSFVKQNGAEANDVKISEFTAEARHRYNITVDVNEGGVGGPKLTVEFDDTVDAELIEVDLSDENLFAAAPALTIEGVANDERIEFVEHSYAGDGVKVSVLAPGGIRSVTLTTQSAFLRDKKGLPPTLELVGNEGDHGVSNSGIVVRGLDGTVDRMAVIDFTKMFDTFDYLDSDSEFGHVSTFKIEVTDRNGKTAESPVGFSMLLKPIEMSVDAVSELKFFETDLVADISYNGRQDNLSFVYVNDLGVDKPLTVNSITSKGENRYSVSLTGLPSDANSVTVKAKAGIKSASMTVARIAPVFSLSAAPNDIFARKAYVTVECQEIEPARLAPYVTFYKGATRLTSTRVDGSATFLVEGLASDLDNTLTASLVGKSTEVCEGLTFHTEAQTQLQYGNMENWFKVDGKTKYWWIDYLGENASTLWGTMNLYTTSEGGSNENSLSGSRNGMAYCAISGTTSTSDANSGNSAALIRTVGWGKGNAAGALSCKANHVTRGELFLGKSQSSEAQSYGISFTSRPKCVSFYYKYQPKNASDYGKAEIIVRDASGAIIASQEFKIEAQSSYIKKELNLEYAFGANKASTLELRFVSSDNPDCWRTGNDYLNGWGSSSVSKDHTFIGSQLYIDDVDLIY